MKRFELYYEVNPTRADHKVPAFLTLIGEQPHRLLQPLCVSKIPVQCMYTIASEVSGLHEPKYSIYSCGMVQISSTSAKDISQSCKDSLNYVSVAQV